MYTADRCLLCRVWRHLFHWDILISKNPSLRSISSPKVWKLYSNLELAALFQSKPYRSELNSDCFTIEGNVLPPFELKTPSNDANFISIDAEFCRLSSHIFSRFLSAVLWKLSNDLCDPILERPSLHNGSTLIGLEKTKEIQFFEVISSNIHPKNMKLVWEDRPSDSASFDV